MKRFSTVLLLLVFCGCVGTRQGLADRTLIITSNQQIVVKEEVMEAPGIESMPPNYVVDWVDEFGKKGLFIGPVFNTNIIIKEK